MAGLETKRFDEPDEVVRLPLMTAEFVVVGGVHLARITHEPGWTWRDHVRPTVGTPRCAHHHQGIVLSGAFEVELENGARRRIRAGDAYDVPPGHDAWVIGDEPAVLLEFAGARGWGKPAVGERVLATLLVSDIVGSTETAVRLGDAAWKELLARHGSRTHAELDRFRGLQVAHTGDGVLALFDGAARAVRCGLALRDAAAADGLALRVGVHSGEVEREADNLRGVAVHAATRIAGAAAGGEVLVSAAAAALLEGSGIEFEEAGEHELKGLPGRRRLLRVTRAD